MGIAGYGRSQIRYDMFDLAPSADEARRLHRCAGIYHRGQELAWDGREILPELIARHHPSLAVGDPGPSAQPDGSPRIHLDPALAGALERVFAIILWGELAAWKISAQLADGLVPLEAKMAATSQAFDEARHFYVMHDYLRAIGWQPRRMDRAPQALLDLVLDTPDLAYKLLGMQLMIETIALTIFQTVREREVEPVLTELMKYYERDEARHVGLGMQYLPSLLGRMTRRQLAAMTAFQLRLVFWALSELRLLEPDFATLGISARTIIDRAEKKQLAAIQAAYAALGVPFDRDDTPLARTVNALVVYLFPDAAAQGSRRARAAGAWRALWRPPARISVGELELHGAHPIKTARGTIAPADPAAPWYTSPP